MQLARDSVGLSSRRRWRSQSPPPSARGEETPMRCNACLELRRVGLPSHILSRDLRQRSESPGRGRVERGRAPGFRRWASRVLRRGCQRPREAWHRKRTLGEQGGGDPDLTQDRLKKPQSGGATMPPAREQWHGVAPPEAARSAWRVGGRRCRSNSRIRAAPWEGGERYGFGSRDLSSVRRSGSGCRRPRAVRRWH